MPESMHCVLIVSANPLFRDGLQKYYAAQWGEDVLIVGTPSTVDDALEAIEEHHPDLVIVDHDDKNIHQAEFMNRFVVSDMPMKVVLVSLNSSETVVVYDRMKLTAGEAEEWLANPWKV